MVLLVATCCSLLKGRGRGKAPSVPWLLHPSFPCIAHTVPHSPGPPLPLPLLNRGRTGPARLKGRNKPQEQPSSPIKTARGYRSLGMKLEAHTAMLIMKLGPSDSSVRFFSGRCLGWMVSPYAWSNQSQLDIHRERYGAQDRKALVESQGNFVSGQYWGLNTGLTHSR